MKHIDYPYLCPSCKNNDTELCESCGQNNNYESQDGDYISRQALIERLEDFNKWCKDDRLQGSLFAVDVVKDMPSVSRTGHWKGYTHSAYHGTDEDGEPIWKPVNVYHCSECNRRTVIKDNFCPNCGAKMNGGE